MAKVFIEESTLTNIGDAIRGKTGKSELLSPASMATEISNITTGGGDIPEIVLTGDCQYACSNAAWNELLPYARTENITKGDYMFANNKGLTTIPFELNFTDDYADCKHMFAGVENLTELPKINNLHLKVSTSLFNSQCIREITKDKVDLVSVSDAKYLDRGYLLHNSYSLRVLDMDIVNEISKNSFNCPYYSAPSYYMFNRCASLDEVIGYYPTNGVYTSNAHSRFVSGCYRIKNFTFELDENGLPYVRNWKNQTLAFDDEVGYADTPSYITSWNSGITQDKQVFSDETYAALKDDADWYSIYAPYSRYNHDSAVNTINTLPDVSQGSGNVIKFEGECGSATDGGAINTLTEEEIAVATAKGWTVTLV